MSEFKKIENVLKYVDEGLKAGTFVPFKAVKFARIIARQGTVGEEVHTWSVKDGQPIVEKTNKVKIDEKTNEPGWVVTKATEEGAPIIDEFGHENTWIIDDSVFKKKYEVENGSLYRPVGGPQVFVRLTEDVALAQWGSYENIGAGGYVNITNLSDIYGISERDFNDTYKVVGEQSTIKMGR